MIMDIPSEHISLMDENEGKKLKNALSKHASKAEQPIKCIGSVPSDSTWEFFFLKNLGRSTA
jgi:hypothetical protein